MEVIVAFVVLAVAAFVAGAAVATRVMGVAYGFVILATLGLLVADLFVYFSTTAWDCGPECAAGPTLSRQLLVPLMGSLLLLIFAGVGWGALRSIRQVRRTKWSPPQVLSC